MKKIIAIIILFLVVSPALAGAYCYVWYWDEPYTDRYGNERVNCYANEMCYTTTIDSCDGTVYSGRTKGARTTAKYGYPCDFDATGMAWMTSGPMFDPQPTSFGSDWVAEESLIDTSDGHYYTEGTCVRTEVEEWLQYNFPGDVCDLSHWSTVGSDGALYACAGNYQMCDGTNMISIYGTARSDVDGSTSSRCIPMEYIGMLEGFINGVSWDSGFITNYEGEPLAPCVDGDGDGWDDTNTTFPCGDISENPEWADPFWVDPDAQDLCEDKDGDGYYGFDAITCPEGDDCDDEDGERFPGNEEICGDNIDNNCVDGVDEECCGVTMPTIPLQVRQCDSRWKKELYDNTNSIICDKGCALASLVMLMNSEGCYVDLPTMNSCQECFNEDANIDWDIALAKYCPSVQYDYTNNRTFSFDFPKPLKSVIKNMAELKQNLEDGYKYILNVQGTDGRCSHFVFLIGISDDCSELRVLDSNDTVTSIDEICGYRTFK